uniref:FHA domain-containing protein n=1 Tax=Steinernema glaseri TaxID=37863 RepID=A0A1I7XZI5_9BILA
MGDRDKRYAPEHRRRGASPSRSSRDGDRDRRDKDRDRRRDFDRDHRRRSREREERRQHRSRSGSRDRRRRQDRSSSRDRRRQRSRSPVVKREPISPDSREDQKPSRSTFRIASLKKEPRDGGSGRLGDEKIQWGRPEMYEKKEEETIPPEEVEKPCFAPSGKLAEDTNMFKGVVIKYNEPPEARTPKSRWRLYPFRGDDQLDVLYIHRQSAYMISREKKLGDILVEHPSCSKQHAVLQYRSIPYVKSDGSKSRRVLPYIIDLGSANGTFLNGEKIEAQRYYELKENDILKFAFSSRDYLIMKEKSEKELANGGGDDSDASPGSSDEESD